ncbi:MAG: helix-turn-helix transcriptional regulator [Ruminococcus flavefaciens]|nr:helix-turn-helix transcriptional regulator [Ruminococcus flavefaciens]MCM1228744.1 helix-turn-helix transcriptional regulator [Ruminococcus flavefaciens]
MKDVKTIITIKDYGKVDICLKSVLDEKNITRNYLAKSSNTRFEVINKWYNNQVEKLDLDVLARICYVLDCSPDDIIKYNNK